MVISFDSNSSFCFRMQSFVSQEEIRKTRSDAPSPRSFHKPSLGRSHLAPPPAVATPTCISLTITPPSFFKPCPLPAVDLRLTPSATPPLGHAPSPGPAPAPPPPHSRGRFLRTESRRRPQAAPPPSHGSSPAAALPAPVPPPLHRRGFPASASRLRGFSSAPPPLRRGSIRRTARPHGPPAPHRAALLNGHRRSHRPQRACAERRPRPSGSGREKLLRRRPIRVLCRTDRRAVWPMKSKDRTESLPTVLLISPAVQ